MKKELKLNKLDKFRAIELMCENLIKVIELHRSGIEPYDSVLQRIKMLKQFLEEDLK